MIGLRLSEQKYRNFNQQYGRSPRVRCSVEFIGDWHNVLLDTGSDLCLVCYTFLKKSVSNWKDGFTWLNGSCITLGDGLTTMKIVGYRSVTLWFYRDNGEPEGVTRRIYAIENLPDCIILGYSLYLREGGNIDTSPMSQKLFVNEQVFPYESDAIHYLLVSVETYILSPGCNPRGIRGMVHDKLQTSKLRIEQCAATNAEPFYVTANNTSEHTIQINARTLCACFQQTHVDNLRQQHASSHVHPIADTISQQAQQCRYRVAKAILPYASSTPNESTNHIDSGNLYSPMGEDANSKAAGIKGTCSYRKTLSDESVQRPQIFGLSTTGLITRHPSDKSPCEARIRISQHELATIVGDEHTVCSTNDRRSANTPAAETGIIDSSSSDTSRMTADTEKPHLTWRALQGTLSQSFLTRDPSLSVPSHHHTRHCPEYPD